MAVRTGTLLCRAMLLVIVARSLSPAEFGVYALIGTMGLFGTVLLGLNLSIYVYRAVPGLARSDQLKVFKSTSATELAIAGGVVTLVAATGSVPVMARLMNASGYELFFGLGLLQIVLLVAIAGATQYFSALVRIEDANWIDFLAQGAWVVVPAALWALGVRVGLGTLLGMQIAGLTAALAYAGWRVGLRAWWNERVDRPTVARAVAFSLPMMVPALSVYMLKMADRPMLSHYGSLADVGVYSFAFAIVNTLYSFTAGIVFGTLAPRVIGAHNAGDIGQRNALQTYMLKAGIIAFVAPTVVVSLIGRPLLAVVAREEYLASIDVLPMVAASFLLIIIAYPAHSLLTMYDRTKTLATIELIGMACGLAGNFLLIPRFSYWGAAAASVGGFAVTLLLKWIASGMARTLRPEALFTLRDERAALVAFIRQVRGTAAASLALGGEPDR